jgi:predicted lipid-binding transport protein (Tim44 family)
MEFKRVMRRYLMLLAALLPLMGALGAVPAEARLGGGHSFGSRGSQSYFSPRPTGLAPGAAPFERSQAPVGGMNNYGRPAGYGMGGTMFGRHPFASGLMGGLIGAGIFGMLFGGGFFHSGLGFGGLFGTLIQLLILFFVIRFLFRMFAGNRGGSMARPNVAPTGGTPGGWQGVNSGMGGGMNAAQPLQITAADQSAFEQCLVYVQQAWGNQDIAAISRAATPEMVGYFNEQLANLTRQGLRNRVADIRVETMELSDAWSEGDTDYATAAMRFSMLDMTENGRGQVVDGSATTRALVTEIWTFTRRRGGHWILAAIQQTR